MTYKPHSRDYAEVYRDGELQKRVHLGDTMEVRKRTLERLHRDVSKAAAQRREKIFWIEVKYE